MVDNITTAMVDNKHVKKLEMCNCSITDESIEVSLVLTNCDTCFFSSCTHLEKLILNDLSNKFLISADFYQLSKIFLSLDPHKH